MVKCPAGTFIMGSPGGESGRYDNETQHQVTISKTFYIGKYEVTQKEYEAVMGKNPSYLKEGNRPVVWVDWNDAKEFCDKLNKYAKNIPDGYRFDLPNEVQWEYACRAGTTTALNNGQDLDTTTGFCSNLNELGWYRSNSGEEIHKVGKKKPNAWGIYDMHGNVCEWCRDLYNDYSTSAVTDPMYNSGSNRVFRGGSWGSDAWCCRSANRYNCAPDLRNSKIGFRLALVPID